MAAVQGVMFNYFEYPKINHVFPVYPIPAADNLSLVSNATKKAGIYSSRPQVS